MIRQHWFLQINPTRKYSRNISHHRTNGELNLLKDLYESIKTHVARWGWGNETRTQYRRLQLAIWDTARIFSHQKWDKLTTELSTHSKDPPTFWRKIHKLRGNDNSYSPFIYDASNIKIYDTEGKERLHNRLWSKTFKISEENRQFNSQFEAVVLRDLERFPNKLKPDKQINLNNLENNNQLITEISLTKIKTTISKMKNKAAGTKTNK